MARGYWIAFVTVTDPVDCSGHKEVAQAAFAAQGAKFLVYGGDAAHLEGDRYQRHVVVEFEGKEKALACYNLDAYQTARAKRDAACHVTIAIVEGLADYSQKRS